MGLVPSRQLIRHLVFAVSVTPVVAIAVASAVIAVLWHVNPRREVV